MSVDAIDPPTIELAPYFFINTIAYGLLAYAVFIISPCYKIVEIIGTYVALCLRQPSIYWCTLVFSFLLITSSYLSASLFHHIPMNIDTCAELVHAKILAINKNWMMQRPPLLKFFSMAEMIDNGKWFSQYPPGHIILLAIGFMIGHAELVNPFLGACTSIAIYLLAKEVYGTYTAKIAVLLSALCSYLICLSSEYMMNATSLLYCTVFLWLYFRTLKHPNLLTGVCAGAALGYCFITRPYTVVEFAMPCALYALYLLLSRKRTYLLPFAAMAISFSFFAAFLLYYNHITTGNALVFGYQLATWGDKTNPLTAQGSRLVFSSAIQWKDLRYNLERLTEFNRVMFEWPIPSLCLLVPIFAWRGCKRDERLLFSTIASVFIGCQLMPGNTDWEWGPRLAYEIIGIVMVLSAKTLTLLPAWLRIISVHRHAGLSYYYGAAVMILLAFYAFSFQHNLNPRTIFGTYHLPGRGSNPDFYYDVQNRVPTPALVFIPDDWQYVAVSFTNPPNAKSPIIFARDLGKENGQLIKRYPNRAVYWATAVEGKTIIKRMATANNP